MGIPGAGVVMGPTARALVQAAMPKAVRCKIALMNMTTRVGWLFEHHILTVSGFIRVA